MLSLYAIIGYLIVLVIFYKVISLVGGALKLALYMIFAAISIYVLYIVFGGFIMAIR